MAGKPVEMTFEFDQVRNFSAVLLHTNNMFSKDVQVFMHAKVFFSIGGQHFNGEPVHFSYMPDTIMEHARDVTIKLHHRIGKFVQIHLYFAARWIMLSEVSFISSKYIEIALIFFSSSFYNFTWLPLSITTYINALNVLYYAMPCIIKIQSMKRIKKTKVQK